MNKLTMEVTSDNKGFLEMVAAESESYFDHHDHALSFSAFLSEEEYNPLEIRINNITVGKEIDVDAILDRVNNTKQFVEMEPTTIGPASQFFGPASKDDQIIRLLNEIKDSLWELQKTLKNTDAPTADRSTSK